MPLFDIERAQFLEDLCADVRGDLIGKQFAIADGSPGGNLACGLPLIDASFNKLCNGYLVGFDIGTLADRGEEFNEFCLGFLLGAAKCLILSLCACRCLDRAQFRT